MPPRQTPQPPNTSLLVPPPPLPPPPRFTSNSAATSQLERSLSNLDDLPVQASRGKKVDNPRFQSMSGKGRTRREEFEAEQQQQSISTTALLEEEEEDGEGEGDEEEEEEGGEFAILEEQDPSSSKSVTTTTTTMNKGGKAKEKNLNKRNSGSVGRRKIAMSFIEEKARRTVTFTKRKSGLMKKAFELSTLTGTDCLVVVVSESGLVYTFATPSLKGVTESERGKEVISLALKGELLPTVGDPNSPSVTTTTTASVKGGSKRKNTKEPPVSSRETSVNHHNNNEGILMDEDLYIGLIDPSLPQPSSDTGLGGGGGGGGAVSHDSPFLPPHSSTRMHSYPFPTTTCSSAHDFSSYPLSSSSLTSTTTTTIDQQLPIPPPLSSSSSLPLDTCPSSSSSTTTNSHFVHLDQPRPQDHYPFFYHQQQPQTNPSPHSPLLPLSLPPTPVVPTAAAAQSDGGVGDGGGHGPSSILPVVTSSSTSTLTNPNPNPNRQSDPRPPLPPPFQLDFQQQQQQQQEQRRRQSSLPVTTTDTVDTVSATYREEGGGGEGSNLSRTRNRSSLGGGGGGGGSAAAREFGNVLENVEGEDEDEDEEEEGLDTLGNQRKKRKLGRQDFGTEAIEWQKRITDRATTTTSSGSTLNQRGGGGGEPPSLNHQEKRSRLTERSPSQSQHDMGDDREEGSLATSLEERRKFWKERARESIQNAKNSPLISRFLHAHFLSNLSTLTIPPHVPTTCRLTGQVLGDIRGMPPPGPSAVTFGLFKRFVAQQGLDDELKKARLGRVGRGDGEGVTGLEGVIDWFLIEQEEARKKHPTTVMTTTMIQHHLIEWFDFLEGHGLIDEEEYATLVGFQTRGGEGYVRAGERLRERIEGERQRDQ